MGLPRRALTDPFAASRQARDVGLALVQAIARPELATEAEVMPPPENKQRKIFAYTSVNAAAMNADWWELVSKLQRK